MSKNVVTLKSGSEVTQGHCEYHSIDVYGFLLVLLVTLSLKCTVFEIFDFQNAVTLKNGLEIGQGHCNCHRSIERIYDFILLFYSNQYRIGARVTKAQMMGLRQMVEKLLRFSRLRFSRLDIRKPPRFCPNSKI